MIHDPSVEISCDGHDCSEHFFVDLPVRYSNFSGDKPFAPLEDDEINEELKRQSGGGWKLDDEGNQYCPECAEKVMGVA